MRRRGRFGSKDRFRVRGATLKDLEELVHQRRGMWEDMGVGDSGLLDAADKAFRRWVKAEIRKERLLGWIVEASDGLAGGGCLWLRPVQPRPRSRKLVEPYLLSMFTEPNFRRKGVASRILNEAIKWSQRNGYTQILLHASQKGRSLYRKYGFTRTWEMRLDLGRERT